MSEQEKQESQKTIVAFAAGLLIGGLLVWVFAGSPKTEDMSDKTLDSKESTQENTDDIKVTDVTIDSATIKTEEKKFIRKKKIVFKKNFSNSLDLFM